MAHLKSTMFREYDLRGQVGDGELNPVSMEIIARAYGAMLVAKNIKTAVLGYDYRSYSESLATAAIKGLCESGIDVINLGLILTPMMYSAQYHYKSEGGIMITASHNPNGWSGVKLALGYSHTFVPDEIKQLKELTISEKFVTGNGIVKKENYLDIYIKDLISRVSLKKKLKVVVNTGNGGAGVIVPKVLQASGVEVVGLYNELDWNFPHYSPNPAKEEMMRDTGKKVVEVGADVGIAIDADGDRLGVVDEKGTIIWPDQYMILLSRLVLRTMRGASIIFDVKSTQALADDITAHGGVPVMWKTGHSYIKSKLHELDAPLAGEMSGHIFFGKPFYYGFDDASFAALKLLEYLALQDQTLSSIIAATPRYISSPSLQVDCADEVKYDVVDRITEEFKKSGLSVNDINGARVTFENGWGLVRASSNMPVLVLRFEGKTQEDLTKIETIFKKTLAKYPEVGTKWESG